MCEDASQKSTTYSTNLRQLNTPKTKFNLNVYCPDETTTKGAFQDTNLVLRLLNGKIIRNINNNPERVCFDYSIKNEDQLRKHLEKIEGIKIEPILTIWRRSRDWLEVISACLFCRVLEGFQAGIILTKYGLEQDVRVIIRSTLEALFILKICCDKKDKDFINKYISIDLVRQLTLMNVAHNKYSGSDLHHDIRKYATKERRSELKKKIDENNININELKEEFKVETLAGKAGMKEFYDSHYRYFCSSVHSLPRSLEEYFALDENRNITELINEPTDDDAKMHLLTLAEFLLIALKSTCSLFHLKYNDDIDDFYTKAKNLTGELS